MSTVPSACLTIACEFSLGFTLALAFTATSFACFAGAGASAVLLVELSLAATVFSLVVSLDFSTLTLSLAFLLSVFLSTLAFSVAVVLSSAF